MVELEWTELPEGEEERRRELRRLEKEKDRILLVNWLFACMFGSEDVYVSMWFGGVYMLCVD